MTACSDEELVTAVAQAVARPKEAPADSFVLHAPLELLARASLLPLVRPAGREAARAQLTQLAATYHAAGPELSDPEPDRGGRSGKELAAALVCAVAAGELDDVDMLAAHLGAVANPGELRRWLGDDVVASLGAAAHASILLSLLPRVGTTSQVPGSIIRGPLRSLARTPDWQLRWFEHPDETGVAASLGDALLAVEPIGLPGSNFIFPIMDQAERSGVASRLLSGVAGLPGRAAGERVDLAAVSRDVCRVAAWSMLQEPHDQARYGWTHCLTLPQAVLVVAAVGSSPERAAAVAATHLVGFRAALGTVTLDPEWAPPRPETESFDQAILAGPSEAAAWAWHMAPDGQAALVADLATEASQHEDAHLVKYTLASIDAARADPAARPAHMAAAAHLAALWRTEPETAAP